MLRIPIAAAVIVTAMVSSPGERPATAASITRAGSLGTARSVHTATLLPTGKILVAGGMSRGGGSLNTTELFDPATDASTAGPPMRVARNGHTATRLRDGRVIIAGGFNGGYERSIEVFDPRTGRLTAAGEMREGRSGHTASLLPNGHILFVGGVGRGWTFLRSAEIYDPATGRSEAVGSMATPRESHTATTLADGRILVTGGHNGRREAMEVFASAEIFDARSGKFSGAGSLVIPRHKHDAILLNDGRVLIVGGADRTDRNYFASTELFDPATNSFSRGPEMENSRYKIIGTSALLPNGDVLITSGARTAELLDTRAMRFSEVAGTFPEGYRFATATPLATGSVMIIGGYAQSIEATDGVWRFRR
jgi:hypothetical protein